MSTRPMKLRHPEKVKFDANNASHRRAYLVFLQTKKWPIQFQIEWPFTSIPAMVMFHLAAKACEDEGTIDLDSVLEASASANDLTSEGAVLVNGRRSEPQSFAEHMGH